MEEFLVGRTVKKEFVGIGIIKGIVKTFDPITGFFEIVYEDGDSEEMEFKEIVEILEGKIGEIGEIRDFVRSRAKKKRRKEAICDSGSGNFIDWLSNDKKTDEFVLKSSLICEGKLETLDRNLLENGDIDGSVNFRFTGIDLNVDISMVEEDNFSDGNWKGNDAENDLGRSIEIEKVHKRKHSFDINLGVEEEIEEFGEEGLRNDGEVRIVSSIESGGGTDERLATNSFLEDVEEIRVKDSSGLSERVIGNACSKEDTSLVVTEETRVNDCNGGSEDVSGDACLKNDFSVKDKENEVKGESGLSVRLEGDVVFDINEIIQGEDMNLGGYLREVATKNTSSCSPLRDCEVVLTTNHEDIASAKPPDKGATSRKKRGRPKKSTSTTQMDAHGQSGDTNLDDGTKGVALKETRARLKLKETSSDVVMTETVEDKSFSKPLDKGSCTPKRRGRPRKSTPTTQIDLHVQGEHRDLGGDCRVVASDKTTAYIHTNSVASDVVIAENHEDITCSEPLDKKACNSQNQGCPSKEDKSSAETVSGIMAIGGFDMNSTPNPEDNVKASSSDVVIAENHEDRICSEPLGKEVRIRQKRGRPKKVKATTQTVLSTTEVIYFDMNSVPNDAMNMKSDSTEEVITYNSEDRVCSELLDKETCNLLKQGRPKKLKSSSQTMLSTIEFGGFDMNSTPNLEGNVGLETPEKEACTPKKRGRRPGGKNSTTQTLLRRSTRRSSSASLNHVLSTDESLASNSASLSHEITVDLDLNLLGLEERTVLPPKMELPPSSKDLNVDEISIIDLFSIYSFLRSFSTILFLSPFSLEAFLEALKHRGPNSLIDSIHFSIMHTLKLYMESLSNEGSQSATNCLRSLDWALLDVVTWPVYMVEYLLLRGPTLKPGFELGHLKAFLDDYYKQSPTLKAEILRCLCDDVIEAECVRSEINRRTQTSDLDMDADRIPNVEIKRKKKDRMNDGGDSCLTLDVVDGSADRNSDDRNSDECCLCKMEGSLICCDGCPAAYHTRCVCISKDTLPDGEWFCPECVVSRYNVWMKSPKSLRGAELLGTDPHGRLYFATCGYLLVLDSCEPDSSYNFYNSSDLNIVMEFLKSSNILYSSITDAIFKNWGILGGNDYQNSQMDTTCKFLDVNTQIPTMMSSSVAMPLSEINEADNPYEASVRNEDFDLQGYMDPESEINPDSRLVSQTMKTNDLSRKSVDLGEVVKVATAVQNFMESDEDHLNGSSKTSGKSEILEETQSIAADCSMLSTVSCVRLEKETEAALSSHASVVTKQEKGALPREYSEPDHYVNYYIFGQNAAAVVRELLHRPPTNVKEDNTKSLEEMISPETRAIFKKSTGFSWPNTQGIYQNAQRENCGWCLCCQNPDDGENCLFCPPSPDVSKSSPVSLRSKNSRQSHLSAVICHILSIEERLCGLLSGPWRNASYSKNWRKNVLKASDVASVKNLLLTLELNIRRLALLPEWLKHVDSVATMGSASHVMKAPAQVPSSKNVSGRKRAKNAVVEATSSSTPASKLSSLWWRGGRLTRHLFNYKILPQSLASKGARQGGSKKIPGVLYSDGSDYAKRSKYIAWRASVEMSMSVAHLAYLVRELDLNIRWDDLENIQTFSHLSKESKKAMKLFKKVTIRRKSIEGSNVKYLLDFGKRRGIPDIVVRNGVMLEISASERKKYWLEESYVPLHILKAYEEKKLAQTSGKMKPVPLDEAAKYLKKSTRKDGLQLLLSKGQKPEYYKCGHCNKDVLIRDAVNCKDCEGFFHKRHVRKSKFFCGAESLYQCQGCRGTSPVKKSVREKPRTPVKKSVEAKSAGRKVQLRKSKRISTFVLRKPLPRKVKYMPLQSKEVVGALGKKVVKALGKRVVGAKSKMVAGAKRSKPAKFGNQQPKKSKEISWYKGKRSQFYAYYWLNGLHLTRNLDDERAMKFRESKLCLASQDPTADCIMPICNLCCETNYRSTASYINCGNCEEWYHGEAFGVTEENENMILGFRCHKCRRRKPPICPYLEDALGIEVELVEEDNHSESECPTDESKSIHEDQGTDSE